MGIRRKTTEQAVQDFIKKHGDLYDYSLVTYQNSKTKVKIICKDHGVFEQTPNNHSKGYGCSDCSLEQKTKSLDKCLQDFYNTHGNTYGYEKVQYKNAHTDVLILCYDHGEFLQTPDNHI